jgi:O-antigen/teichoic acid export membrane protein
MVDFSAARELFAFGLKIQTLNLSAFLYEPLTRFMIAYVGGLHLLGLYELASRIVAQARQLAIVPASNLLAVFAVRTTTQRLRADYERAFLTTTAAGAVLMFAVAVLAPAVSLLWLGGLDWEFLAITATLAIGWGVNISSAAAYYLGIAQNRLRWNIIGAMAAAFTSPVLVYAASLISPAAIGLGTCVAVSLGALITLRTAAYPAQRARTSKRLSARSRLLFRQAMSRSRLSGAKLYLAPGRRVAVK